MPYVFDDEPDYLTQLAPSQPAAKKPRFVFDDEAPANAAPQPKERSAWEDFAQGGGRVLTERGIGIIQLLDEATGGAILSPDARAASYRAMQDLSKEKEQEGALGTISSFAADPLMALPFARGLKGVKALAASGAVAGGASEALRGKSSEEEDRLVNTGAGTLVGGIAGPIVGKAVEAVSSPVQTAKNAAGYLGKALGVVPENVKTFDLAGVSPTLGDVSKSGVVKRAQNTLDDVPIASSIIDRGKDRVASQIESGLAKVGYDPTFERVIGGDSTKDGLQSYIAKGKKLFSREFDNFDKKYIPGNTSTAIDNTLKKILEVESRADTPQALDAYLGATEKDIIKKIQTAVSDPAKPELSYNDLKLFRTAIGKKLEDFTIGSSDKAVLRELYGSMTADLRSKASAAGPSSLKAFDRLNSGYAKFISNLDNNINDVVNKGEATEIFNAVRSGLPLPAKTSSIMRALPDKNRNVVRGSLIRELGVDRTMAGQGEFNASRFAAKFKALEPKAQKAILIGLPKAAQDNFMKVVDAAALAGKTSLQSNPSGSARTALLAGTIAGGVNPATMALTAKLVAGGAITAKMMTSPRFIKWLANAPKQIETNPSKYIARLSAIAASDEANREDIENYKQQLQGAAP